MPEPLPNPHVALNNARNLPRTTRSPSGNIIIPRKTRKKIARKLRDRIAMWRDMPSAEMRLRAGEMTAQEIRTVRAVLAAILPKEEDT